MKLTKKTLNKLILEELSIFLEGEDDAAADLFGGEEEGGEEEAADEPADEGEEAEGGEEADEGGEEEDTEGEEEDTSPIPEPDLTELPADERAELTKVVDDELNTLFMDFEAAALSSVAVQEEEEAELAQESYVERLKRYLFEGEEDTTAQGPSLDVHRFSADTARLINHYVDLLDMEQLIFNKAKYFLLSKYDQALVDEFEEILEIDHGISFGDSSFNEPFGDKGKPETPWPPRAQGAQPPAA